MSRLQEFLLVMVIVLTGGVIALFSLLSKTNKAIEKISKGGKENIAITPNDLEVSSPSAYIIVKDEAVKASMAALLERVELLEESNNTIPAPIVQPAPLPTFQPQVIYLGSATTTSREWVESGVEIILNKSDYPDDANVSFQANLSIIGGEAWARLKNKTTGAVISTTEVFHSGSTATWKSSPTFKLHSGSNNYVVELHSTSGEVVSLSGARLIISK